jgi:plastocyanin
MGKRKTVVIAAAALAVGLLLGACGRAVEASGNISPGPAPGDAVKVEAKDNEFRPGVIKAKAGEQVTVQVTNQGEVDHNLVIPGLDVSTGTLKPGEVATATFVMPDSSTEFVCTFHGGMKGDLQPS